MADTSGVDNLTSSSNGSTSLTGIKAAVDNLNTAKQEKGSGVTGDIPTFGSGNVLGDSGKTLPGGTIVGTSDTQTLTSKTLTSPTINTPTVTSPTTTGTDSGTETLQNKTIAGNSNTISGITEAMQSLSDVTTGNVSTSAHGFAPKAPNDATKYLDGTGAYSKPSSLAFNQGKTTKTISDASTSQTIAHGLGVTPKNVRLTILSGTGGVVIYCNATYNGSATAEIHGWSSSSSTTLSNDTKLNVIDNGGGGQTGVVTVDSTNITITWTKVGSPAGTVAQILWEAMG